MSNTYSPVLWNRQKKIYDRMLLIGIIWYLILFAVLQMVFYPEISIETLIIRGTGSLAFLMLHIVLCIGPLSRLNARFLPLLYNRRHFGVALFLIGLIHGIFNLIQFHALGNADPLVSIFTSNTHYDSFLNFPFQIFGFFALLILFVMAATSHDFWLKNLSPKVWKSLHMMVYVAYAFLLLHVFLGIAQLETAPLRIGLIGLGLFTVTGLHLSSAILEKRKLAAAKPTLTDEGFVKVCELDDIEENRAKMILVGEENIAVFKYDGKVSAVNNSCRHQNGPLGEGKIIDGCVTCPWHGYQYHPHNGQSPPPFTEKLTTYDVKLVGRTVYVHPKPYPEGTERPCAKFNS